MAEIRNARSSVRVAFVTSSLVVIVTASGSGAITFNGSGTATASVVASGGGTLTFAGLGTATTTYLGGTASITFDARGTAKISPVIVAGTGGITFGGRGDIDVAPHLDVYAPPEWSWMVLDPDGTTIGPLTVATARKLTFQLDGSATATFTMPGEHPETATIAELGTDLYVARNGRPLFRGRIGGSSETHAAALDTVNVTAIDYRGLLDHRLIWPGSQLEFGSVEEDDVVTVDQSDIAWQLISDTQTLDDLGITRGRGSVTGVGRVRTFTAGATVSQSIKDVAGVVDGFDWEIGPDLAFNIYCPERGRYPADVVNSAPILTYGRDVVAVTTTVDPSKYGNAVYFTGSTNETDPATPVAAAPPGVGRWELQRADVNANLQTTVDEEAEGQLAASSQLISAIMVTLAADVWNPYLLWLGDRVRVLVDVGRLDLDVTRRIMQIDVTLDDTGVETVALAVGSAPPKLSDRLAQIAKDISDIQRHPPGEGGGGGGGGGGDGGIKEITSIGGTILITAPTGPTTNLEVASGVGRIAVTNPTGPSVNLEYAVDGSETVYAVYLVDVLPDLVSFHDYGFYSFGEAAVSWLRTVPFDEAGFIPEHNTGEPIVRITQSGTYQLTAHVETIQVALGHDLSDNVVVFPIDLSFMGIHPFGNAYEPGTGIPDDFTIGVDSPETLYAHPATVLSIDLDRDPHAAWHFGAQLHGFHKWLTRGAQIRLSITLTRVPL